MIILKMRKALGFSVRNFRESLGISQEEAAYRCCMDVRVYGNVERGVDNFEIETLEKIVEGLGMYSKHFDLSAMD